MNLIQVAFFFLALTMSSLSSSSTPCPMNLNYVQTLPWNTSICTTSTQHCCQALLSLFGIGLALHLKHTSLFQLPDFPTASACVHDFQSKLNTFSLPPNITSTCLGSPERFHTGPQNCAGIKSLNDWKRKLGSQTELDSSCRYDLSDSTSCDVCLRAGLKVQARLTSMDGNASHSTDCFYFTILYAGGVVNEYGPERPSTAACIFGLPISSPPKRRRNIELLLGLIGVGVALLLLVSCLSVWYFVWDNRRKKKRTPGLVGLDLEEKNLKLHLRPNTGSIWFELKDLEKATDNFSERNLIGRGGFGIVYKGTLSDGTLVAVKKIIESSFEGNAEFCNEVEIISSLRHRNLVPLRGCCVTNDDDDDEGQGRQRYLVYDYMPNGNLEDHLFFSGNSSGSNAEPLSWPLRKSVILDVAKGLAYLHYGVKPSIYHRDIKVTNILLDTEMKARVADFGLVKQIQDGESHLTTRVAGTHGYLAPEYALYGQLTEKSDVYSFGVVVLEIMSGRRALDLSSRGSTPQTILITDWAWTLVKSGQIERVLDMSLFKNEDSNSSNSKMVMQRFVLVGILCAHVMVAFRPTITDAMKMLEGDIELPTIPDRPLPLGDQSFINSESTFSVPLFSSKPQPDAASLLR